MVIYSCTTQSSSCESAVATEIERYRTPSSVLHLGNNKLNIFIFFREVWAQERSCVFAQRTALLENLRTRQEYSNIKRLLQIEFAELVKKNYKNYSEYLTITIKVFFCGPLFFRKLIINNIKLYLLIFAIDRNVLDVTEHFKTRPVCALYRLCWIISSSYSSYLDSM